MTDKWSAEQVLKVLENRVDDLHAEIIRELAGFPELYSTQVEMGLLRSQLESIREDHVRREEVGDLKTALDTASVNMQKRFDQQQGRRSTSAILSAVIATILAVMFGVILNSQISRAEVSDQIQREAPWNKDKIGVEARIAKLENQEQEQRLLISQMQTQIRFFCATRTKAGLPGC